LAVLLSPGDGSHYSDRFVVLLVLIGERDSSVGVATVGVRFPAEAGDLFFYSGFTPVLGPTQPHIEWVPGALFAGLKRPGREADC
jgi:hypothetical protein